MDLFERTRTFFKTKPDVARRVAIVAVLVAIGIPSAWWFIHSAEEKAYVYFTNGYYQYRNHLYSQAGGSLGQLVSLYPNSKFTPLGRYYLALTQLGTGNYDEASAQFQYFMDQNPKHFLRERIYPMWMSLELNAGRPESAVSVGDRYLAEFGRESQSAPEVLYRKGVALLQLGHAADADKCFDDAASSKDVNIFGNFAFYAQTARPHL